MLLQFFSLHQKLSTPGSTSSLFKGTTAAVSSSSSSSSLLLFDYNGINNKQRRTITNFPLHALEKDSEFELDRDKAREALKQLDQQLQTLSKNDAIPPKRRISFPNLEVDRAARDMVKDAPPEFSESFFAYSAFALLMFTMLYNIIFLTIIKPAVDGPEPQDFSFLTNNTTIKEAPNPSVIQQSTPPTVLSDE